MFDKTMALKIAQEKYLSNTKYKGRITDVIQGTHSDKIFSCQIQADAYRLIIKTAVNLQYENIAIGFEDVDILILLTPFPPTGRECFSKTIQRQNYTKNVLF